MEKTIIGIIGLGYIGLPVAISFSKKFEVVVPDEMLSLAIGRRGQNVRLAAQLTGGEIDILTEEEESERRQEELRQRSELFMDALVIDEMMAQLLATEGFRSVEEVAYVEEDELAALEGFDQELAEALQQRASAVDQRCSQPASNCKRTC